MYNIYVRMTTTISSSLNEKLNRNETFTVIAETINKEMQNMMYMAIIFPNVVNHIGISVSELEKAIDFYKEVFGFNIIKGPINVVPDTPGIGLICKNIFGPIFKEVKIVWLSSGNNVGQVKFLIFKRNITVT